MKPTLKVTSPWSQETVREVPYDDEASVEQKLALAHRRFLAWRNVPRETRIELVREGVQRMRTMAGGVACDVTLQMGKPIREALREVETCCERAEHMISIAAETLAPEVLPAKQGFHLRIEHEPLGVVLDLAAWNYPLLIPVNVVVPALLAGNTVLLKHSARTPLCGLHFERAFGEGDPPGVVQNLVLGHEAVARIIADPRIDHVAFTGSVEGGREVYRKTAERFIDAGLELGGKDPAYIAEDADIDFAAENVIDGACYNAGQSCCAVERVYVHRSLHDRFIEKALKVLEAYKLGDPLDESTTMGPLASRGALDLLEKQVDDAVRRGAKLLLGGKRIAGKPNLFPPTLLTDVPNDALIMQEESFGPVVPVLAVKDDGEALERMRDTRYGLTASIWTASRERAERFAREIDAGTIYQNRCDYLDPALPWTGVGDSGKGSTLSRYGFYGLTRRKAIHFKAQPLRPGASPSSIP